MSNSTLESTIENLQDKADRYQDATNFEARLNEYTADASSAQASVYGLLSRLKQMERLKGIYTEVFDEETPDEVSKARRKARQELDRSPDDYWKLIDDGKIDQYEQKVQTAKSKADEARQSLRDKLNEKQSDWEDRVSTGRRILTLMSDTREAARLFDDIEDFVTDEMWDDSKSVTTLQADWQGIQRQLESGTVADWEEFQRRHGLSDGTIDILKDLADGERVTFSELSTEITDELLNDDDISEVLEVTL